MNYVYIGVAVFVCTTLSFVVGFMIIRILDEAIETMFRKPKGHTRCYIVRRTRKPQTFVQY